MNLDRKHLFLSLVYAAIGLCVGIVMAVSKNHSQQTAHVHLLLVGFALSFFYAVIHKLWLGNAGSVVAKIQFVLHHLGAIAMFTGLTLLSGSIFSGEQLEPVLGASSVLVLVAALLMLYMTITTDTTNR